ncbi:MAG TPA: ComEC/Rec2 family competence protein [Chthoniobacteraceae bacterium]|jgi:ComEC/Rec2-related protein
MKLWALRQPCTGLALAAGLGVGLADRLVIPLPLLLLALLLQGAWLSWRPRTAGCIGFALLAFATLHTIRHHGSDARALAREFTAGSKVVQATGVVWSEPIAPKTWSKHTTCRFRLKLESIMAGGAMRTSDALVEVHWAAAPPAYGDRVELRAGAANVEPVRNPGQFDFPGYLRRQGVYSELRARYASDCRVVSHGHGRWVDRFCIRARSWVKQQIERDLTDAPTESALILSMLLGTKGETPEDVHEQFQRTGTLHLLAVSGLHVAMIGAIVLRLLKVLRVNRRAAVVTIIVVLCLYSVVTGLSTSCVRATIMGVVLFAAFLFDRPVAIFNSLGAAALLILAWDTNQLFSPGFQFSFALVFTIVIAAGPIESWTRRLVHPDAFLPKALWSPWIKLRQSVWGAFAGMLGVTLAAWLGSLIFMAGYFHLFSVGSIFANLALVPIAFAMLGLALFSLLAAPLSTHLVVLFNNANWVCAKAMLLVVEAFAVLPGGHHYVELPTRGAAPAAEFTVLDLQGGGAIHLRSGDRDWLIDCGSEGGYKYTVLPYLRSRGVNRLDGFLATHGDAQHLGAALPLLADFRPRLVADSPLKDRSPYRRVWHRELAIRGNGKALLRRGDELQLAPSARLRILYPAAGLNRSAADDKALVFMLESSGVRLLFTSDSGFFTEQWLREQEPDLRADVLVKGQHARDVSGTAGFLAAVQPRAIICSDLGFAQPAIALDAWEKSIAGSGIAVFRQDVCGAVQASIGEGVIELRGYVNGQTFRSRAR